MKLVGFLILLALMLVAAYATGPVLARILFERAEASDAFIASVVARWLSGRQ